MTSLYAFDVTEETYYGILILHHVRSCLVIKVRERRRPYQSTGFCCVLITEVFHNYSIPQQGQKGNTFFAREVHTKQALENKLYK